MKTKMELKKEINYKIYEWDFNDLGLFEVSVDEDGTIRGLRFCEKGSGLTGNLYSTNKDYLRAILQALKELFSEVATAYKNPTISTEIS